MNDKVLLAVLKERQSARGTRYLSGWLGKARLVAFLDKDAPEGETVWQVFAQSPDDRAGQDQAGRSGDSVPRDGSGSGARRPDQRQARSPDRTRAPVPVGELDDGLTW